MLTLKQIIINITFLALANLCNATQLKICADCQFQNLAHAVSVAADHDTLLLQSGIYPASNVQLSKPITLIGESGAVLDGENIGHILHVTGDSVIISGLKFINSGKSFTKDYAAIYLHSVKFFIIEKNTIVKPFFGLLIEKSKNGLIHQNHISNEVTREDKSGNGIHLWHSSDITISNNETFGLRDGIYFEFVTNSIVKDNLSHNNIRYGLHFMFSNHDQYINNTFSQNGAGVAVMFSKFIVMKNNVFQKNWGAASYGLLLKEIYDTEVIDNRFEENTIAIFLEGTGRINYKSNTFISNGWAVKVSGGCYTNIFENNNFLSNALDVSYNSKLNDNEFRNNYWSEYVGYDLDKNGIGDVPYRPVKLFSYIISQTPESIILLRSLFVDIINFSERVSPIFTPDNLIDATPSMLIYQ